MKSQDLLVTIPYNMYNNLEFITPENKQIKFEHATDWHFCCN